MMTTDKAAAPTEFMCPCCGHKNYKNGRALCDYCFRERIENSRHQCKQPAAPPEDKDTLIALLQAEIKRLSIRVDELLLKETESVEALARTRDVANFWIDEHVKETERRCAAERAFDDLRKADQESLTEALAAAIEQMKRAETAEEALARIRETKSAR